MCDNEAGQYLYFWIHRLPPPVWSLFWVLQLNLSLIGLCSLVLWGKSSLKLLVTISKVYTDSLFLQYVFCLLQRTKLVNHLPHAFLINKKNTAYGGENEKVNNPLSLSFLGSFSLINTNYYSLSYTVLLTRKPKCIEQGLLFRWGSTVTKFMSNLFYSCQLLWHFNCPSRLPQNHCVLLQPFSEVFEAINILEAFSLVAITWDGISVEEKK